MLNSVNAIVSIPATMFTYPNGSDPAAHGNTPFHLMHGRDPRLPEELLSQPEATSVKERHKQDSAAVEITTCSR